MRSNLSQRFESDLDADAKLTKKSLEGQAWRPLSIFNENGAAEKFHIRALLEPLEDIFLIITDLVTVHYCHILRDELRRLFTVSLS
jgi:hypothetical protein